MDTINKEFVEYAETEIVSIIKRFVNTIEDCKANQISKEIVTQIDWNNSALMHKGLSWMTKNYLIQNRMI